MAAITGIVQTGPPIRWGLANGKALIAEMWRVPASTAGDTQTLASINIAKFLGLLGDCSYTAVTDSEAGVSVPVTTLDTIAASNFANLLLIGLARDIA